MRSPSPSRRRASPPPRRLPKSREQDPAALALQALGRKERTERELGDWLRGRGVEEAELETVISELVEAGALDDREYARRFAEEKRDISGWGPDRIAETLGSRGVAREHIEAALEGEGEEQVLDRALLALEKSGRGVGSEGERSKALAFLGRRGYPLELAYEAVRRAEREAA